MTDDNYKKVSARVEADWYPYHENEWFTHTDICQYFQWTEAETRKALSRKLYHDSVEVASPVLEKNNKAFKLVDKTLDEIDWDAADPNDFYKIKFPYDFISQGRFSFEELVNIPPRGLIAVAGVSNAGKTSLLLGLLMENMDDFDCHYFTSELSAVALKRRMIPYEDFYELRNGDGKPKFHIWDRSDNYHEVVRPDGLNFIDYLDVNNDAEYFKMKPYLKRIKRSLNRGVAIVALQKPPGRQDAYGGSNLRGDTDLYIAMDFGLLTIVKAKDCPRENPTGFKYKFSIEDMGAKFTNISQVYEE